jgi:hypothetical protein
MGLWAPETREILLLRILLNDGFALILYPPSRESVKCTGMGLRTTWPLARERGHSGVDPLNPTTIWNVGGEESRVSEIMTNGRES